MAPPEYLVERWIRETAKYGGSVSSAEFTYRYEYSKQGDLYEYWDDPVTGKHVWSRHHSDHGNPKYHKNPHDHSWYDDDDGNNRPGPPLPVNPSFHAPEVTNSNDASSDALYVGGALVGGVALWYVVKWSIAVALALETGGASVGLAAAIP